MGEVSLAQQGRSLDLWALDVIKEKSHFFEQA